MPQLVTPQRLATINFCIIFIFRPKSIIYFKVEKKQTKRLAHKHALYIGIHEPVKTLYKGTRGHQMEVHTKVAERAF